jgi:hypothetical protein
MEFRRADAFPPGKSARAVPESGIKIDYRPGGRKARWESTVEEQKRSNPHLADKNGAEFVALRNAREGCCRCQGSSCMRCR